MPFIICYLFIRLLIIQWDRRAGLCIRFRLSYSLIPHPTSKQILHSCSTDRFCYSKEFLNAWLSGSNLGKEARGLQGVKNKLRLLIDWLADILHKCEEEKWTLVDVTLSRPQQLAGGSARAKAILFNASTQTYGLLVGGSIITSGGRG